jgi:flagellin
MREVYGKTPEQKPERISQMLSIQTNVNSLMAQQNLNVNNEFQSKTIEQLTSGYRINSSGDDAAGLAVANQLRDNISQVTQGVANGNDAQAQLQIMDGGISNISQILDRLQTLAAQSASGTFTGDRTVLNNEFQTDIGEINRQSQAIGLNTGGTFAKSLAVYLGGGSGTSSAATLSNATVTVDLSKSTVDAQSLGLNGVQASAAVTATSYDLSSSSATSVADIIAANGGAAAGAAFTFQGAGFGDSNGINIAVNLNGVANTTDLVTNINAAIQTAAQGTSGAAAAFKAANITASIVTDSATGKQSLAFSSSNSAFSVTSGATAGGVGTVDKMAAALMGDVAVAGAPLGNATAGAVTQVAAGSTEVATAATSTTPNVAADLNFLAAVTTTQAISFNALDASGNQHSLTVNLTAGETLNQSLDTINTALQKSDDSTLQQITAVQTGGTTSTTLNFISTLSNFAVNVGPDSAGVGNGISTSAVGVGDTHTALQVGTGSTADISTLAGATAAVSAVSAAVGALGTAQAAIGKGENQLNYAVNLASSQITNFSAAESQIRDADVAQQAANLTKAQTLQQASIAAMAQANSAPQAVLSLLKG